VPPNCAGNGSGASSTDTPLPINDLATTSSVIALSVPGTYLFDLDVVTEITHTFAGDLDITLTSPAGTVVTLTTDNGAGNDNVFNGTTWDDDGGTANPPGAVSDNVFANLVVETPLVAEEALAAFQGEDPNGNWTLAVADDAGADTGTLVSWTLLVTAIPAAPISDPVVTVASTDTPLPITDMTTTTSTLAFAGAGAFACDVDLTTDITHTFAGDLDITLTSPAGTAVTITTDNGAGNDNVFAGTFWDDGGGGANPPGPVTDNVFANLVVETPLVVEEALGAFVGEDPNGNWTLEVFDDAGADVGSLASWSLSVTSCTCVQPDADLSVTKSGAAGAGDQIVWTVTVTNNGPDDATGVVVTDPLDACTTYVSDDCGGANVPPWTWNVGNLANGASATCNITVDASACPVGNVSNSATATGNETDPDGANNTGTASVGVGSILEIPTASAVGLAALALLLAGAAFVSLRRRSA
jgi:uncharacterized repeat protein (TIGR01451 family)